MSPLVNNDPPQSMRTNTSKSAMVTSSIVVHSARYCWMEWSYIPVYKILSSERCCSNVLKTALRRKCHQNTSVLTGAIISFICQDIKSEAVWNRSTRVQVVGQWRGIAEVNTESMFGCWGTSQCLATSSTNKQRDHIFKMVVGSFSSTKIWWITQLIVWLQNACCC